MTSLPSSRVRLTVLLCPEDGCGEVVGIAGKFATHCNRHPDNYEPFGEQEMIAVAAETNQEKP